MILLWYGPPAHKWGQKQHQPTKHRVSSYLKWNRRKIDSNWIVHSRENALFFQTHVLLTEQDRGKGMKVMDLGLSSNWAPGRDGCLSSHLGASHLLTRPFSRGIDGGQGYRLRAQNDVKLKVKRLKQTSMKEKRHLECKIWVNHEPGEPWRVKDCPTGVGTRALIPWERGSINKMATSEKDQAVLESIFNPLLPLGDIPQRPPKNENDINEENREDSLRAKELEAMGVDRAEQGNFDGALECFNEACEICPSRSSCFNNRAQLWRLKGNIL